MLYFDRRELLPKLYVVSNTVPKAKAPRFNRRARRAHLNKPRLRMYTRGYGGEIR